MVVNHNLVLTFMDQVIVVRLQQEYSMMVVLIEELFTIIKMMGRMLFKLVI